LWLVDGGKCVQFDGDLDDYKRMLMEARRGRREGSNNAKNTAETPRTDKKADRKARADARAALSHLRKNVQNAEKQVNLLILEKKNIEEKLADPIVYSGPNEDLTRLQIQLGKVEKKLQNAERAWLEAESQLENTNV